MDGLDYELNIVDMLDEACGKLSDREFQKLLDRVREAIEDYE